MTEQPNEAEIKAARTRLIAVANTLPDHVDTNGIGLLRVRNDDLKVVLAVVESGRANTDNQFMAAITEFRTVLAACAQGYGDSMPYLAVHDAAKRLYRMGWRKLAPPILDSCRRCGAENVVTVQATCIKCVGKPAYPDAG